MGGKYEPAIFFVPPSTAVNTLLGKFKAKPHLRHSLHYCERRLYFKQGFKKVGGAFITLIKRRQIKKGQTVQSRRKYNCCVFNIIICKRKTKDTYKVGNSFGSPMHVYLRIFLACVPTQLVKAFGIKRLNIYCLVRNVWPLQRQRSAPGVGGWVGR